MTKIRIVTLVRQQFTYQLDLRIAEWLPNSECEFRAICTCHIDLNWLVTQATPRPVCEKILKGIHEPARKNLENVHEIQKGFYGQNVSPNDYNVSVFMPIDKSVPPSGRHWEF